MVLSPPDRRRRVENSLKVGVGPPPAPVVILYLGYDKLIRVVGVHSLGGKKLCESG